MPENKDAFSRVLRQFRQFVCPEWHPLQSEQTVASEMNEAPLGLQLTENDAHPPYLKKSR